jgi:hypothetical protein
LSRAESLRTVLLIPRVMPEQVPLFPLLTCAAELERCV